MTAPPSERRSGPTAKQGRSRQNTDATDSSLYRRQDGYSAPTAEDRLDAEVIAAAEARGFAVAVRCRRCSAWCVSPKSVAAHLGPVCRAKLAVEAVIR